MPLIVGQALARPRWNLMEVLLCWWVLALIPFSLTLVDGALAAGPDMLLMAHVCSLQVLMVLETPQRAEGEAAADYAKRVQNERILALNPNYGELCMEFGRLLARGGALALQKYMWEHWVNGEGGQVGHAIRERGRPGAQSRLFWVCG